MRGGKYQFVNLKTGQYQVGKGFINFTTEDGLVDGFVPAIHQGPDGVMWFGTDGGGVSRYDGKGFVNFTQKDDCQVIRSLLSMGTWME